MVEIIGLNNIRMNSMKKSIELKIRIIGIVNNDLSFFIKDKLVLNMYQEFANLSKKPILYIYRICLYKSFVMW